MAVTAWAAGQRITADGLNAITPIFTAWTPTWSTSTGTGTPSIGNGTYDCEYSRVGNLVTARFEVVFGTTTNFGGGGTGDNWRFSLPVTAAAITSYAGTAVLIQSTTLRVFSHVRLTTTGVMELEVSSGQPDGAATANNGLVDLLTPWTWASANSIRAFLTYEAA
ncbi:hypothetical protein ACFWA4_05865 [Streptomyces sp. NPDC060011]|uniref:hypothetical protein n=1 Tax=Streptomyces sp. NPDC060011 TaxID=3347037 RepID=UPI0036B40184